MSDEISGCGLSNEQLAAHYIRLSGTTRHASDCATSVAPAERPGPCDCEYGPSVNIPPACSPQESTCSGVESAAAVCPMCCKPVLEAVKPAGDALRDAPFGTLETLVDGKLVRRPLTELEGVRDAAHTYLFTEAHDLFDAAFSLQDTISEAMAGFAMKHARSRTVSLEAQLAERNAMYEGMLERADERNGKLVEALRGWQDFYPDCAQLLDGWHVDTAWTDWDTSVRRSLMRHSLETAEALGDTKTAEVLRAALEDKC